MGNTDIIEGQIQKACKLAKGDEFVKELPLGYETVLSENVSNFSGGQRQCFAIDKALLKQSVFILLCKS